MTNTTLNRDLDMARRVAQAANAQGGRAFFVGGFVRDQLLRRETKDVDIEVHGLTPAQLAATLDRLGERVSIGESFGVFTLRGYSIDVAMPRTEKPSGNGHRDFEVSVDPFIGTKRATMRRDFTINALMQDVLTGEIIDHFMGREDLRRGVIRHVCDETFAEDPLRALRAAQFAARFGFSVADETIALCRDMSLLHLSRERIDGELRKALLQSTSPSVFFETLRAMNRLSEWFPELEALEFVPQNPKYHAEGDVWTHTMMTLDAAALLRDRAQNPLGFMLAVITHDFGKAVCTETIRGEIHAYDHEKKGLPLAQTFLSRITGDKRLIEYALNLADNHMRPNVAAASGASIQSTNRMFDESIDPEALICMALADDMGRISEYPHEPHDAFLYERLRTYRETMARPAVTGRDLVEAGLTPDKRFSEILRYAHKLRLAGVEKESALKQTLAYARKSKPPRAT